MRAIVLISGGLDSLLAARVIKKQGIDIVPVIFSIPFCKSFLEQSSEYQNNLIFNLQAQPRVIDISDDFLKLLLNPRYGFGANMNPCIDCKILMFSKARELLKRFEADFLVTGEVLGQRPMSQNRQSLELIEKRAGVTGLLLRPLSARILPPTIPEEKGWILRDNLLALNGRGRRDQVSLANDFGILNYAQPAGGCLLTDESFSGRIKDLMEHEELNLENVRLLKSGRHFRLGEHAKLIVGRNELENAELEKLAANDDCIFLPDTDLAGPTALGKGQFTEELIKLSASIVCRYSDLSGRASARVIYKKDPQSQGVYIDSSPFEKEALERLRI